MKKIWIMHMTWKNVPYWLLALGMVPFPAFVLMFVFKAYGFTALSMICFVFVAGGSLANLIIGLFFPYQYPRKQK